MNEIQLHSRYLQDLTWTSVTWKSLRRADVEPGSECIKASVGWISFIFGCLSLRRVVRNEHEYDIERGLAASRVTVDGLRKD